MSFGGAADDLGAILEARRQGYVWPGQGLRGTGGGRGRSRDGQRQDSRRVVRRAGGLTDAPRARSVIQSQARAGPDKSRARSNSSSSSLVRRPIACRSIAARCRHPNCVCYEAGSRRSKRSCLSELARATPAEILTAGGPPASGPGRRPELASPRLPSPPSSYLEAHLKRVKL